MWVSFSFIFAVEPMKMMCVRVRQSAHPQVYKGGKRGDEVKANEKDGKS